MTTVREQPEQRVILDGVAWDTYELLLREHEGSGGTRFNYDRGTLEIMVLSAEHERLKQTVTTLVELIAAELEIDVDGVGSTTFKKRDVGRGFEADASFYIKNANRVAGKARIDLEVDPPPDLAIEIDITHPSLDKLSIYAELQVPEIWRYDGSQITILVLSGDVYRAQEVSEGLGGFGRQELSALIEASKVMRRSDWVRLVRQSANQSS